MRVRSKGGVVSMIYDLEMDVNIVWPMDFTKFPFDVNHADFRLSTFSPLSEEQFIFVTEGSLPPDTHLDLGKVRNYEVKTSYLSGEDKRTHSDASSTRFHT